MHLFSVMGEDATTPQAKCALGPPAGPYVKGERNTYTRKFAHADVFVDLRNRTNSRVAFVGCEYR